MNFSMKVKNEILTHAFDLPCCKTATLSAFIRGAGAITGRRGKLGFEFVTENENAVKFYSGLILELFGVEMDSSEETDNLTGRTKYIYSTFDDRAVDILLALGVIESSQDGLVIKTEIDKYLIENDCCKKAYVVGAFIGGGSVTIPQQEGTNKNNYHLETVFSLKQIADDYCQVLAILGFFPKLTERKDKYVVYFKGREEISDMLTFMGATGCSLDLQELIVERDVNNKVNRRYNCDMSNLSKQIEASIKQIEAIKNIEATIGLDGLPPQLKETALLRLNNPDIPLTDLAEMGEISKSCLNHRLRKILEISKNLG